MRARRGNDVFFVSESQLVSQDTDNAYDMYDAHACTAVSPCFAVSSVSPPECASADACRPGPTPQPPIFGAPASATFTGPGNPVPRRHAARHKKAAKKKAARSERRVGMANRGMALSMGSGRGNHGSPGARAAGGGAEMWRRTMSPVVCVSGLCADGCIGYVGRGVGGGCAGVRGNGVVAYRFSFDAAEYPGGRRRPYRDHRAEPG